MTSNDLKIENFLDLQRSPKTLIWLQMLNICRFSDSESVYFSIT